MNRLLLAAGLFLVLSIVARQGHDQGPSEAAVAAPKSAEVRDPVIDSLAESLVSGHAPGLAVLAMKDGRVIHRAGYGVRSIDSGRPVTPNTLFYVASTAKMFTAAAVSSLVDEGRLRLSDSIGRYVPAVGSADRPDDSHYYDFWPGTWYRIVDGVVDTTSTRFRVEPGIHPAAFEESWRLVIDSETTITARAFRAWDSASERWRYVWLSDAGQFQVWEGRKVGDHWYMYKEFEIEGRRVLSRQAWIPIAPGRLERISEHSSDGGRTWQRRFREEYARVSTGDPQSRHDRCHSPPSP